MKLCMRIVLTIVAAIATATPAMAITSIADGMWTDPAIWDENREPDMSLNDGSGEPVIIGSNVTVPSGVDFVNTTTIDPTDGSPASNNWMFFDVASTLGSTLTIQDGARVGTQHWTFLPTTDEPVGEAIVNVESGGEFVSSGVQNNINTLSVNVDAGGLMTFDASIHPNFTDEPNMGFYRGNINAGDGAENNFNISGRLDVFDIDNPNVGDGTNTFSLIDGGIINEVPLPGQAVGDLSGNAATDGNINFDTLAVAGSGGTIVNAFSGDGISTIPAGLTVDISDQSVLDANFAATAWGDWVTANGGDPLTMSGPRRAPIDGSSFTFGGTLQFDVYGFNVNDQGTPGDTSDDTLDNSFSDQVFNGPGAPNNTTYDGGMIEIGYVGGEITDDELEVLNAMSPALLLFQGPTNGTLYSNLVDVPIPSQVWDDGNRQYMVEFFDTADLGDPRQIFAQISSITVLDVEGVPGDYNDDGFVNAADYVVYRNNEGQVADFPNRDAEQEGQEVGAADYEFWVNNFGNGTGGGSTSIPEPASLLLLGLAAVACGGTFRQRRSC